ncbi:hydrogenase 2 maturation endopeptidase [Candidatus Methanoplasma termitum]|uniref:Hydrogenase 2 maturation endopeptidase n=1 Tax=Candidatus Methanoplasma termitum TaxID=1577791 RepID=A0A0A7LCN7_9ARCH|nr:hydrogenase maturation protease [Candidatus Methanoplasma termitum]AIZ56763.1 hydrogenase 2 maturation endopeptidase [Candidatus Methanoplasma termitum]MCL2333625.1 hydrogenase maturation protease [Candidatus Methanoplasma sp.]
MGKLADKTIVIGLGSPIMSDDAVGLKVSEAIESLKMPDVDTLQEAVGGLEILPMISGYRFAIIVDAILTGDYSPGTVLIFEPESFDCTVTDVQGHDVNLATALKIGRQMDNSIMPEVIRFVAIEVEDLQTMSEVMTPKVAAAVGSAKNAVLHLISEFRGQAGKR